MMTGPALFGAIDWLLSQPWFKFGATTRGPPRRLSPKDCLTRFYREFNPQKLKEVDKILGKYQGSEKELFRKLSAQYDMRIDCLER